LKDRGTLAPGCFADINVFDFDKLATRYPDYVYDFPGNKGRFIVQSEGYAATLVNGQVIAEDGRHTGTRSGRVLRSFDR
jgi:N-acyl-D-aspartate/D-glutamate deacylase